jgi:hypothetical protein
MKYQDEAKFKDEGIQLEISAFKPPQYKQLWDEFIPNLSVIDYLFNMGATSLDFKI